jgi:branched-chain amino acid transport system permease protein
MTYSGVTGGDDGLRGFAASAIHFGPLLLDPSQPIERYYIMFGIVALILLAVAHILASPFGTTLRMIRENEERALACGVNVRLARLVAFVLSGLVCGLAGGLYAIHLSTVPIDTLSYGLSGQVVMMTLLGGMGTFVGPFIGAAVFLAAEHLIADITTYWQMVVGGLFIALVLYCPHGIWGTAIQGARW